MLQICGCSLVVELQPSKLIVRVRFPSSAPYKNGSTDWYFRFFICHGNMPISDSLINHIHLLRFDCGRRLCLIFRNTLPRLLRCVHRYGVICALAENSPPDCFLIARLRIHLLLFGLK